MFLLELDGYTATGQVVYEILKISEISTQPVERVNNYGVTFTNVLEHCLELRPVRIFTTDLVFEYPVQRFALKLPCGALIQAADAPISNALSCSLVLTVMLYSGRSV
jgi:hypothetical protein